VSIYVVRPAHTVVYPILKYLYFVLLTAFLLQGCSSAKWDTDYRPVRGSTVAIALAPGFQLEKKTVAVSDSVAVEFQNKMLDSLMQASLFRYIEGMSRGGHLDAAYTESAGDSNILFVIEQVTISRSFSFDFVLRGPVLKATLNVAAYRGTKRIFETRVSDTRNMAYAARNGRRFYWMSEEDKNDPEFQMQTLLEATRFALGTAYNRFFNI
jgi:hypothetical protein